MESSISRFKTCLKRDNFSKYTMELVRATYVYISYVTQTLLTNLVGQLSLQGFFYPPSLPLNLIVTMLHVLCTIYMYIWFPPSLRDNFCNTKFVYDFVVFSFECHLRDRPFNLQGGGLWFFVSFRNVFSDNTRVRIFFFSRI